jgi:type I restriction enzyme S subunit
MHDWRTEPLERIAEIRSSNVDKKTNPGEETVRLCNYMDVYSREYITEDIDFMEATATPAEIQRFGIERGDVLITKDSETPDDIGIPAVVVDDVPNLVCGYHVALIKPNRAEVDPLYLAKQLGLSDTGRYYGRLANGSTRYGLSYQSIARTPIRLAPLPQQQRIAEILATVDEAIEQTGALIAKTQQIKAGLMHDLFTRGITAEGQLKPASKPDQADLSLLPDGWTAGSLLDVADEKRQPILTGPFGADLGNDDFVDDGVPVLRIGNVQAGYLELSDLLYVTPRKAKELARYVIRSGDLLFARQGATTGRNSLASDDVDGCLINYHIIRVALDHAKCAPLFIEAAFNSEMVKRQVERDKGRGTREGINTAQLKALRVPLAPVEEQRKISEILAAQNEDIQALMLEREKLRWLKHGLMHNLLTGGMPIEVDVAPKPMEAAANV